MKTALALILILVAGLAALYHVTDGFRVVTTEDARRLSVQEQPRDLPATLVQYESGPAVSLAQSLHDDGRVAIVTFIYTRCNAVCSVLGAEYQQLQRLLQTRGLNRKIRLLSISFDDRDGQAELAAYAMRMRAHPADWRFARMVDAAQRDALLQTFGVTVIPAPLGEFQHNAAFHVLTAQGKLTRIIDYDQPEAALAYALSLAGATMHAANPARHGGGS